FVATPDVALDCMSYGPSFGGMLSDPTGTPALKDVPGGLVDGQTLVRTIARSCSTLLEKADDTNDSGADFSGGQGHPLNNASQQTTLPCPIVKITKAPKKLKLKPKKGKAKATFKFKADVDDSKFQCSIDAKAFKHCKSPFTTKLKKGKHTLAVEAKNPDGGLS